MYSKTRSHTSAGTCRGPICKSEALVAGGGTADGTGAATSEGREIVLLSLREKQKDPKRRFARDEQRLRTQNPETLLECTF